MGKWLLCFLVVSFFAISDDIEPQKNQSELQILQEKLNKQTENLKSTSDKYESLVEKLRQDEKAIGQSALKLKKISTELNKKKKEIKALEKRKSNLENLKEIQQNNLANQLASIYTSGKHDYVKMLLNQQEPASMERLLIYYNFLNKARINAIEEVKRTEKDLQNIIEEQSSKYEKLKSLADSQTEYTKKLKQEQNQRQATLNKLNKTLENTGENIKKLQKEEAALKQLITASIKAENLKNENTPVNFLGLEKLKGKLEYPTKGKLVASYGSEREAGLRWKGIMLKADEGTDIYSIADGKVIYSDWLKGSGLLLVIDHGKGYMSLYAHAQALLKSSGDIVRAGDTIALVGNSGGNYASALYFELRYQGKHINPSKYFIKTHK